jgi:hypothetical protein
MRRMLAVIALTTACSTAYASKDSPIEYIDLLSPELVGEIASRPYDVRETVAKDDKRFIGTTAVDGGLLWAGGIGFRLVLRVDPRHDASTPSTHGLHLSFEASVGFGRLTGANGPFLDYSTATRGEFLSGLGYEVALGRYVVLHTATMVGVSIQDLDAANLRDTPAPALSTFAPGSAPPPGFSLEAVDLRLGQQVGLHVQVAKWVALFADGTVDYDGQWRARVGISLGAPRSRGTGY